jgi:hypothetical protein
MLTVVNPTSKKAAAMYIKGIRISCVHFFNEARGTAVVGTLCYKPEECWFEIL